MSELLDMLRVQARLHRKQGANALGDLFESASNEIELLKKTYNQLFDAVQSEREQLAKANERVKELENSFKQSIPIVDTLYALARNQLWIAYVWNDHNFPLNPEKYAKEAAESMGITNVYDANKLVEAFKQLRKEQE